jgi:phosphate starvation-inducible PhoH-like protein
MGRKGRKAAARKTRRDARDGCKTETFRAYTPLQPRNATQAKLLKAFNDYDQIFVIGPAGTGKTYLAARHAIRAVLDGHRERVYVARSTVAKPKHRLGFRPGKQNDKVADWLVPIMTGFKAEVSAQTIDRMIKDGKIVLLAFETLRGMSLEQSVVLLDEAQNCDVGDLRLFLTRTGADTQVIVAGDTDEDQIDIPDSGLAYVAGLVHRYRLSATVVEFSEADVVRSVIAKEWVKAFRAERARAGASEQLTLPMV